MNEIEMYAGNPYAAYMMMQNPVSNYNQDYAAMWSNIDPRVAHALSGSDNPYAEDIKAEGENLKSAIEIGLSKASDGIANMKGYDVLPSGMVVSGGGSVLNSLGDGALAAAATKRSMDNEDERNKARQSTAESTADYIKKGKKDMLNTIRQNQANQMNQNIAAANMQTAKEQTDSLADNSSLGFADAILGNQTIEYDAAADTYQYGFGDVLPKLSKTAYDNLAKTYGVDISTKFEDFDNMPPSEQIQWGIASGIVKPDELAIGLISRIDGIDALTKQQLMNNKALREQIISQYLQQADDTYDRSKIKGDNESSDVPEGSRTITDITKGETFTAPSYLTGGR